MIGAEQARQRAALIITRIKAGEEPVPLPLAAKFAGGPTVAELARRYLEEHVAVRCKPKTARTARSVVNRHIVPALGRLPLAAVERQHVMELHESLCETPAMANMTVNVLTHMYALARGWEMAPEGCDPCRSIPMNPKRRRERFLTDAEFTRLGQVLDEVSGKGSRVTGDDRRHSIRSLRDCPVCTNPGTIEEAWTRHDGHSVISSRHRGCPGRC